jgi:hypothetical protein
MTVGNELSTNLSGLLRTDSHGGNLSGRTIRLSDLWQTIKLEILAVVTARGVPVADSE